MKQIDLVIFGDTHEQHREVDVPFGDVLIFTGDFTMFSRQLSAIEDFNEWLGELPHRHKLVVPGNHESFLERDPRRRSLISNGTVLIDDQVTVNGLRIYGSPMTPAFGAAFGKPVPADRIQHWKNVPKDVNVLVTHGPPYGILDAAPGGPDCVGDPELLQRISALPDLSLHCFGHVHGAFGIVERESIVFVNAALMGAFGAIDRAPVVLRIAAAR